MRNPLEYAVKELVEDLFETILEQSSPKISVIAADWDTDWMFVETMVINRLGKMLISYSKK